MSEYQAIGIDLNGLYDNAAFDNIDEHITGGGIPSVLILNDQKATDTSIISGKEATGSMIGRNLPHAAASPNAVRIPVTEVFDAMRRKRDNRVRSSDIKPAQLMAAAIIGLAEARGPANQRPVVVTIPDDGTFNDDAQQHLINAMTGTGLKVQLLWRPVAALLAMNQKLRSYSKQLDGREIGVVSCLDEGITISRLQARFDIDTDDETYLIPKRLSPGRIFRYPQTIGDIAAKNAEIISERLNTKAQEVLWCTDIAISAALGRAPTSTVIRSNNGWTKIGTELLSGSPRINLDSNFLDEIDAFLSEVNYLIYEGPALETPVEGKDKNLLNLLKGRLREDRLRAPNNTPRQTLEIHQSQSQLVSRGCLEYGIRLQDGRKTYFDQLPQLRLAVSKDREPVFVSLINPGQECEGGKTYDEVADLNMFIPPRSHELQFYLFKEGESEPRKATETLRSPPTENTQIVMRIVQSPAQGRARLTIQPTVGRLSPINVNWDHMQVLEGETEETISEKIRQPDVAVPPVTDHPSHSILWTVRRGTNLLNYFSIADLVDNLASNLPFDGTDAEAEKIEELRTWFYRFSSPYSLTAYQGINRHQEKKLHRPISSNGELPVPGNGLTLKTLDNFQSILAAASQVSVFGNSSEKFRNQATLLASWCFLACPEDIIDVLLSKPDWLKWRDYCHRLAKTISTDEQFKKYFTTLEIEIKRNSSTALTYHAEGLFYLLSLRENACFSLTSEQAHFFANALLNRVSRQCNGLNPENIKRAVRSTLRAMIALMRYRLVEPGFLTSEEKLGGKTIRLCSRVRWIIEDIPSKVAILESAIELTKAIEAEEPFAANILGWDGDDVNNTVD